MSSYISLNNSIKQGHFIETTNTVEKVLGRKPIAFKQFISDNKNAGCKIQKRMK